MSETLIPRSASEVAATLAAAAARGRAVRIVGGATKLGWGGVTPSGALRLATEHLSRVTAHDTEAMSATIGAGAPLARVQAQLARSGRMLAIDPQLGLGQRPRASVGGVLATADSGPLCHCYGPPQAQVTGLSVALSDGRILRSGLGPGSGAAGLDSTGPDLDCTGPNLDATAGYDLRRLMIGAFGTLGVIVSVDVRLHPLPARTATALGSTDDPRLLRDAVLELAHQLRDLQAFDLAWRDGQGGLLAQLAGEDAEVRAAATANAMLAAGLRNTAVRTDDASDWARQRAGQRSAEHAVLRVHVRRSQLDQVLALARELEAMLVGRAALGVCYLTLNVSQIASVRARLPAGSGAVVLDLPASAQGAVDCWGLAEGPELELMRQIKRELDTAGVCNPGVFTGRI